MRGVFQVFDGWAGPWFPSSDSVSFVQAPCVCLPVWTAREPQLDNAFCRCVQTQWLPRDLDDPYSYCFSGPGLWLGSSSQRGDCVCWKVHIQVCMPLPGNMKYEVCLDHLSWVSCCLWIKRELFMFPSIMLTVGVHMWLFSDFGLMEVFSYVDFYRIVAEINHSIVDLWMNEWWWNQPSRIRSGTLTLRYRLCAGLKYIFCKAFDALTMRTNYKNGRTNGVWVRHGSTLKNRDRLPFCLSFSCLSRANRAVKMRWEWFPFDYLLCCLKTNKWKALVLHAWNTSDSVMSFIFKCTV